MRVFRADAGRPVVSAAIVAPASSWLDVGDVPRRKTVSASSGTAGRTPVTTEDGSSALQTAQRLAVLDTSPPQFGHLIRRRRPRVISGSVPAPQIMWPGLENIKAQTGPFIGFIGSNVTAGRTERGTQEVPHSRVLTIRQPTAGSPTREGDERIGLGDLGPRDGHGGQRSVIIGVEDPGPPPRFGGPTRLRRCGRSAGETDG